MKNLLFFLLGIAIMLVGIEFQRIENLIKEIPKPEYKVYYEYDVYNYDTIPVDTIYVRIR